MLKDGSSLTLNVTVPVNATASVAVPVGDPNGDAISESGRRVWQEGAFVEGTEGVLTGREGDDAVIFEIGSGNYTFEATRT